LAKKRCSVYGCPGQEVDTRITALFAMGGVLGAFGGARLSHYVPANIQLLLFACVMLGSAIGMLRRKAANEAQEVSNTASIPFGVPLGLGASIGLLTGLIGVGGGVLIVPALTLSAKFPIKRAMNMSLWIIAANSFVGLLGYLGHTAVYWQTALFFFMGSMVGMVSGQRWGRGLSPRRLQVGFACLLVGLGLFTLVQNLLKHTG